MGLFLQGGTIVGEEKTFVGNLRIHGEKIVALGEDIQPDESDDIIDVSGKIVLPGGIDAHVHYKMAIDKVYTIDNFETGSRSALCGGITSVIDYAEPVAGLNMRDSLNHRVEEARRHNFVDYSVHMTISGDDDYTIKDLKSFKEYGINSLKLYTTYGFIMDYEKIRGVLKAAKEVGMVVTIHSEDHHIVEKAQKTLLAEGKAGVEYHSESRPAEAEIVAVKKFIEMCEEDETSVHIVHVSTGSAGKLIKEAKERGVNITAETCPHYLFLNKDCYKREDRQLFVMQPPLRSEEERKLLWDMFLADAFDFVTTDHCAYDAHQKFLGTTFMDTNGGLPGTETLLPVLFSEGVSKGNITIEKLCELLMTNPAKLYGLYPQKGVLREGADGDIVVIDPDLDVEINKELIHTAADYSTFEGMQLKGYPILTLLRGELAYYKGQFFMGEPNGRFVKIS